MVEVRRCLRPRGNQRPFPIRGPIDRKSHQTPKPCTFRSAVQCMGRGWAWAAAGAVAKVVTPVAVQVAMVMAVAAGSGSCSLRDAGQQWSWLPTLAPSPRTGCGHRALTPAPRLQRLWPHVLGLQFGHMCMHMHLRVPRCGCCVTTPPVRPTRARARSRRGIPCRRGPRRLIA